MAARLSGKGGEFYSGNKSCCTIGLEMDSTGFFATDGIKNGSGGLQQQK